MTNHQAIADLLKQTLRHQRVPQNQLARDSGLASRTLQLMLSGEHDFKVSSLFAVADRLGLEMVLVPKAAAAAVQAGQTDVTEPVVLTQVQAALSALKSRGAGHAS
jgi:DNA-binding phage protein